MSKQLAYLVNSWLKKLLSRKSMSQKIIWFGAVFALILSLALSPLLSQSSIANEPLSNQQVDKMQTFNSTFIHHMANVDGVRLHYVIGGKGDPVVLLHGWPQTWYEWRQIMPALASRYTVIAPDLRGMGDSAKPDSGYDKRTIAEDIYKLVRSLGFQKIFLVGHDWGGAVAYAYAAAHRDDVRRLAILEKVLPGFGLEQVMDNSQGKGIWHIAFLAGPGEITQKLLAGKERLFLSWFYPEFAANPKVFSEADIDEYVRTYSAPETLHASLQYYQNIFVDAEHNRENAKVKLKMPVLALGGEALQKDGPLKSMQQVAQNVRGGVVPNCGHWIAEEQPGYLTQQLLAFFGEDQQ